MNARWTSLRTSVRADWRHYISPLLLVVGVVLVGYVASQYYQMHQEQKRLQAKWEQQQKAPTVSEAKEQPADDGLIRLTIPKIDLAAIVVNGTTRMDLKSGPGKITGTPLPGEVGNSVISAHRDTFFRHIYELRAGDE